MNSRPYQICTNCVMDTSDSTLQFDGRGWCQYCCNYHDNIIPNWHPDERGLQEITPVIDNIKKAGKAFVVTGQKIEQFASRTDFDNEQAVQRLRDIMKKLGILHELARQGIKPGQTITFGHGSNFDFRY